MVIAFSDLLYLSGLAWIPSHYLQPDLYVKMHLNLQSFIC